MSILLQASILFNEEVAPSVERIWNHRSDDSLERAATFFGAGLNAGYIFFLREHIPEDARVILPPRLPAGVYSHVGLMQFFLFPRDIHNCGINEVEACVSRVRGSNTYILALKSFPPRDLASEHKRLVPYEGQLGVFVPR